MIGDVLNRFRNILSGVNSKLFGGRRRAMNGAPETPSHGEQAGGADKHYVLLTRRSENDSEDMQGLPEEYYCVRCREYFVLAWHDSSSLLVKHCEVVENSHPCLRGRALEQAAVFCPKCNSEYPMYGPIPHAATYASRLQPPEVYEAFEYAFPPDVTSSPNGWVKFGSFTVERIVVLLSGEIPDRLDLCDFACSGVYDVFVTKPGHELFVSDAGGVRLHVLRVSAIGNDETGRILSLLQREVYMDQDWGTRIFLTVGPVKLRPPLGEVLFCQVQPPV